MNEAASGRANGKRLFGSPALDPHEAASPKLRELAARIDDLARQAAPLEPSPAQRKHLRDEVVAYAERFLDGLAECKTYNQADEEGAGIADHPISETGRPIDEIVATIDACVDQPSLNPAAPGHLGYIPGGGLYPSSLADYLAAVTNRFAGIYFTSPGAVRMNALLIRWLADLVGYGEGAGGDLASGGSIANLTAVVTAREALGVRAADVPRAVVYSTRHVHHCVGKALVIAGMRESPVHHVEMDDRYRMSAPDLAARIEADLEAGLRPFMVVASAGTTDTGAVDPVGEIADVAEAHGVWHHVDAAYGGFFLLSPEAPAPLRELHRADSVVLDPHKGLFLPYGSGALVVRDREALRNAHMRAAPYLRDTWTEEGAPSPADHSPELTRHFRAMRLWLPLQLFGVAPFRACISEKYWLARYLHEAVQRLPHIEVGPEPDLSVVLFRHVPPGCDADADAEAVDAANERLVQRIHADGRVFISSTTLNGRIWLRFAVLSFRTRREHADLALTVVREAVAGTTGIAEPAGVGALGRAQR